MSFSMTLSHVIGDFPLFFFEGLSASSSAFLTGVSLSILIICPFSLLLLITLLHFCSFVLAYISADEIFLNENMILHANTACDVG